LETIEYTPEGTCCRSIRITLENDIILKVDFEKGCPGNLKGIKALVEGMHRDEVVRRLRGIDCYGKDTSCPAQLALALSGEVLPEEAGLQSSEAVS
jgi:uncharacterized protein (TIGR03905 family)